MAWPFFLLSCFLIPHFFIVPGLQIHIPLRSTGQMRCVTSVSGSCSGWVILSPDTGAWIMLFRCHWIFSIPLSSLLLFKGILKSCLKKKKISTQVKINPLPLQLRLFDLLPSLPLVLQYFWLRGKEGHLSRWRGWEDMAVIRRTLISHWVLRAGSQALTLLEEEPEEGWYKCGYLWERWALSVNHHLLSFNLSLRQGSKLEQVWHSKAEMLLRHIAMGMTVLGLSARGNTRCSMGRHFLVEWKAPLD